MQTGAIMFLKRIAVLVVALSALCSGPGLLHATPAVQQTSDHTAWVQGVLTKIFTIKPGMTRADVLNLFTEQGGFRAPLEATYVSRDCRFFKIRVTFRAVGRPERDAKGRATFDEDPHDVILTVSQPFLQFDVMD